MIGRRRLNSGLFGLELRQEGDGPSMSGHRRLMGGLFGFELCQEGGGGKGRFGRLRRDRWQMYHKVLMLLVSFCHGLVALADDLKRLEGLGRVLGGMILGSEKESGDHTAERRGHKIHPDRRHIGVQTV